MDIEKYINNRNILIVVSIIVLFIGYMFVSSYLRIGTVKVDVRALPEDSEVFINGEKVKQGTKNLEIGDYTFKSTREGYQDDEYSVQIRESVDVRLLPKPLSESAEAYFNDEDKQALREAYGGARASLLGLNDYNNNPIVKDLPVKYFSYGINYGPFSIDYGYGEDDKLFLIIDNSSPNGRKNAQQWFIDQNYDVAKYQTTYKDFNNPLLGKVGN